MINAVNAQFSRFVEFAEERVRAGKDTAIARTGEVRVGEGTPLEERAISTTDKLGKSLAEDPFGATEKIDKFCTYLENNGPAALSVADGKDVDLNRLFKQVVG